MIVGWRCLRCERTSKHPWDRQCGLPSYTVTVRYDDGTTRDEPTACPLAPIFKERWYERLLRAIGV